MNTIARNNVVDVQFQVQEHDATPVLCSIESTLCGNCLTFTFQRSANVGERSAAMPILECVPQIQPSWNPAAMVGCFVARLDVCVQECGFDIPIFAVGTTACIEKNEFKTGQRLVGMCAYELKAGRTYIARVLLSSIRYEPVVTAPSPAQAFVCAMRSMLFNSKDVDVCFEVRGEQEGEMLKAYPAHSLVVGARSAVIDRLLHEMKWCATTRFKGGLPVCTIEGVHFRAFHAFVLFCYGVEIMPGQDAGAIFSDIHRPQARDQADVDSSNEITWWTRLLHFAVRFAVPDLRALCETRLFEFTSGFTFESLVQAIRGFDRPGSCIPVLVFNLYNYAQAHASAFQHDVAHQTNAFTDYIRYVQTELLLVR